MKQNLSQNQSSTLKLLWLNLAICIRIVPRLLDDLGIENDGLANSAQRVEHQEITVATPAVSVSSTPTAVAISLRKGDTKYP